MSQLFADRAISILQATINAAATSLTVEAGKADRFPVADTGTDPVNTAGKDWFKAVLRDSSGNWEIVYVRTRALGSAVLSNVQRAQEGTTAIGFAAGSIVRVSVTAEDIEGTVAHPNDDTGAHAASAISNTPAGNIAATTVQAAINELDTEKAAASHTHTASQITDLQEASEDIVGNLLTTSESTGDLNWTYTDGSGTLNAVIKDDAVTFAKMQNIATDRLLGRATASSGNVEELTIGAGLALSGGGLMTIAGQTDMRNGVLVASVASGAITIALKTLAGNDPSAADPVIVSFRAGSLTSGTWVSKVITAAMSIVVPNGATLGFANSESGVIHVGLVNGASAVELVVTKDVNLLDQTDLITTTVIGSGSDSATGIYSNSAHTSKAVRYVGAIDIQTGSTAGSWTNSPTAIRPSMGLPQITTSRYIDTDDSSLLTGVIRVTDVSLEYTGQKIRAVVSRRVGTGSAVGGVGGE